MKARIFLLLLSYLASVSMASAATISTIFTNGEPGNRIDIVVVSEGYTAAESAQFTSDANSFFNSFFNEGIFIDYKSYFNVRSIFVASAESGASHRESNPPVVKNTAFGAFFGCEGIPRLICADFSKIKAAVSSVLAANQSDYIMLLVNDPANGGTGGSISTFSKHPQVVERILHEFGHQHGLLADEYTENPPACNLYDPYNVNVTTQTVRSQIKWNSWIAESTPIPTSTFENGVPGLYQGAAYCESGMYRPTVNSRMRSLGNPYDQVNDEQMVKRFYNFVSPIDSATPAGTSLSLPQGRKSSFSITPLQPVQHSLLVSWYVDGASVASGNNFILETSKLTVGSHSVGAIVQDKTTRVRSDPTNLTSDSQTWTVTVTDPPVLLSSRDVSFGSVNVSDTQVNPDAITLANAGTTVLTINSITLTGTDAAQFDVSTTCGTFPAQITVGGNCTIVPSFKPTRTGALSAAVSISHDAAETPDSINLSGIGADFAISEVPPAAGQPPSFTIKLTTTASPTVGVTTFTAMGNPPGTTVTFTPQSIPAGTTTGSTVLAIGTTTPTSSLSASLGSDGPLWPFVLAMFGTMVMVSPKTRVAGNPFGRSTSRYTTSGMLATLLVVFSLTVGCSDKGDANGSSNPSGTQNTPETYVITVTATSGVVSRTTQVHLTMN